MNKDYLTSPFNDDNFKNTFELLKSIREMTENTVNMLKPTFDTINSLPLTDIANMVNQSTLTINAALPNLDYIKEISQEISTLSQNSNIMLVQQFSENLSSLINSNIPNLKNINPYLASVSFESFYKDSFIGTHQEEEKYSSPANSKNKDDIVIESEKVEALKYAFFEFIISCKLYKESLNHNISYSFERTLSNFGYSSALSTLISLVKPNDPLFLVMIFLIMGVIQNVFKEK